MSDTLMQRVGADVAYKTIKTALDGYLTDPSNFEHVYHCAHELLTTFTVTPGAADEFKPVLVPFLDNVHKLSRDSLQMLCGKIVEVIYSTVSGCCTSSTLDLGTFERFLERIRSEYVTRIYTTNYDDFPLQACPDLYDGLPAGGIGGTPFRPGRLLAQRKT
ncbi:MAG: hypothetical protein WDN48_02435 [Pseudolabrys sp.]